ncbi:MAG: 2-oxoglutarate dehydrogenase complex dihydrolipoyllysine-residue succinyltransferase [Pirellulales bacterium]|nr:2-oxoglutarate dehydrogenase complex dihydrolipoyllysine-residue succinyltransferase [Pirellulales bacterium]
MPIELVVPKFGESVNEGLISKWHKSEGDSVKLDENIVEIESDKATSDLPAPGNGRLGKILKPAGEKVLVGEVIGYILTGEEAGASTSSAPPAAPPTQPSQAPSGTTVPVTNRGNNVSIGTPEATGAAPTGSPSPTTSSSANPPFVMPAAQAALAAGNISPAAVTPTGPGGRMLKEDVQRATSSAGTMGGGGSSGVGSTATGAAPATPGAVVNSGGTNPGLVTSGTAISPAPAKSGEIVKLAGTPAREENFVQMSPIRQRIAQRLLEAQATAAMLTTFNEIDMSSVMELRAKYNDKDAFKERHGVKLGFTSFFVKAAIDALKLYPAVNAEIRDPHIVYKNYYDVGIAVGGGKGLLVPILRNAETMSFADIERRVADFGKRAGENKIKLDELAGGTFTISNGGVYGSLLSTPILNPPQSGILGLHAIQDRPVARNGQVVIRPMMYVALTYDHRIVDGREAVSFLKRIKDAIEDPSRLLLEA